METISPIGVGIEQHLNAVHQGVSGAAPIVQFDARSFPTSFACEVTDEFSFAQSEIPSNVKETFQFDRKAELFSSCTELLRQKISQKLLDFEPHKRGIFLGIGFESLNLEFIKNGVLFTEEMGITEFAKMNNAVPNINKILNPAGFYPQYASARLNARGPRASNLSACAASSQAIGAAYRAIRDGRCSTAITGGVDSTVSPFTNDAIPQLC